jgi:hypothetical protein
MPSEIGATRIAPGGRQGVTPTVCRGRKNPPVGRGARVQP